MNKTLSPVMMAAIAGLVVVLLAVWGYRTLSAPAYTPSPGVTGAAMPGKPGQTQTGQSSVGQQPPVYYPGPAPGSMPGRPGGR